MRKPTQPYYTREEEAWIQARIAEAREKLGSRQSADNLRAGIELCLNARLVTEIAESLGFTDEAREIQEKHLEKRMWITE